MVDLRTEQAEKPDGAMRETGRAILAGAFEGHPTPSQAGTTPWEELSEKDRRAAGEADDAV